MCLAVYFATGLPMPLLPWNAREPGFCVYELGETDQAVKRHFTLPYVYYVGSHEGCGCGFLKEGHEASERMDRQANYAALAQWLTTLPAGSRAEFFACWEGEQEMEPSISEELHLLGLTEPEFEFSQSHFGSVTIGGREIG